MAKHTEEKQGTLGDTAAAPAGNALAKPGEAIASGVALARVDEYRIASLAPADLKEIMGSVAENMGPEGFNEFDLTRFKVPSGGATQWEVGVGPDNQPIYASAIEGVLIAKKNIRVMWDKPFGTGPIEPPVCTSDDGQHGVGKYAAACQGYCKNCPKAQFGTKPDAKGGLGKGQACQARTVLFMLTAGDLIPKVISVPPASLFSVKDYMLSLCNVGKPYHAVLTRIKLRKKKNDGGVDYAEVSLTLAGILPADAASKFKAYSDMFSPKFAKLGVIDIISPDEGGAPAQAAKAGDGGDVDAGRE